MQLQLLESQDSSMEGAIATDFFHRADYTGGNICLSSACFVLLSACMCMLFKSHSDPLHARSSVHFEVRVAQMRT